MARRPVRGVSPEAMDAADQNFRELFALARVEYGGDDTEGYYKYADGRLECYKVVTIASAVVNSVWGSGYELAGAEIDPGNFLYPFIVAPRQQVWYAGSDSGNSAWAFSRSDPTVTAWGKAKLARFTIATITNARIVFEAKGRWK